MSVPMSTARSIFTESSIVPCVHKILMVFQSIAVKPLLETSIVEQHNYLYFFVTEMGQNLQMQSSHYKEVHCLSFQLTSSLLLTSSVSSTWTTASAPDGNGAPVVIRQQVPLTTVTLSG